MRMLKIIVLCCVLAALAVMLKARLDTPQGPQPLPRALITTHLHRLAPDLALPPAALGLTERQSAHSA